MSIAEPTKQHVREALLFCFNLKKSAVESHRLLSDWLAHRLKRVNSDLGGLKVDFDVSDKERPGQPKKYEDAELLALLDENSAQTIK